MSKKQSTSTSPDAKQLPVKNVKAAFRLWKVTPYKDANIYIRQWGVEVFEYLVAWKNQIYADHIIVKPEGDKKKLSKEQEMQCFSLILTAATTTVDTLRGEGVTGEAKEQAAAVVDAFFPQETVKPKAKKGDSLVNTIH